MKSLKNKVQLIGHLGFDPEIKTLANGTKVARISLATTDYWKDNKGEKQSDTQWHRLSVWGKTAEIVEQYLKKGSQLMVEGRLKYDEYLDKEGQKRYTTEIVVNDLMLLDKKDAA